MTEDKALPAAPTVQVWKPRAFGKCPRADDGVVAPIVAFLLRPTVQTFRQKPSVDRVRELLQSTEQGLRTDQGRAALNETCFRVRLKRLDQVTDRGAAHQTISIQNDHRLIGCAPVFNPIANVADLFIGVLHSAPVVNRDL